MALTSTTLSSAVAVTDTSIVVASATGFAAGNYVLIDQELMQVVQTYVSGTTVGVTRGQNGTATAAHVTSAKVLTFLGSDESTTTPQTVVQWPVAGRARVLSSITSTPATLTLPAPGSDAVVMLNGTSIIALTVPVPTKDMDGTMLYIASNGAAAHTVTFTGGLSGAGGSYDVITVNASAPVVLGPFMAVQGLWQGAVSVPMAGTVTNLTGTIG